MLLLLLLLAAPPPIRPLPGPSAAPLAAGPAYFVDASKGDDRADGSRARPWKTIRHAAAKLRPGDTLVLRAGVYHEHTTLRLKGTAEKPITVRSHPGERATLDGGYPEFLTSPKTAWEPVAGRAGEYRSTRKYPELGSGRRGVAALGNFAGDMVPLHGYRFLCDFRSSNPYWTIKNKVADDPVGIYCGPGLWFDTKSMRIHCRLAHTKLKLLGKANYSGETGPRKLPLVVAGAKPALAIENARHLRLLDLTVRGSAVATLSIADSSGLTLDGLHVYGGSPAVSIRSTQRLTLVNSAVRGLTAPWSSRASHKYRGNSAYLLTIAGGKPGCSHFTFAHSEFTDNHDGLILGTMSHLDFHHNLVDHFDDDGLYLTLQRPKPPEGIRIHQNVLSRCLTTFAHAQSGKGIKNAIGPGVIICRNIIDLRRGTPSAPPASEKEDVPGAECWNREGRLGGDHGSPVWEGQFIYHNTILTAGPPWRGYYGGSASSHNAGSKRRVFNNLFLQLRGKPGSVLPSPDEDFAADGNLHWSVTDGPSLGKDYFATWRKSKSFTLTKKRYAPGWAANDVVADPKLRSLSANDFRLSPGSPAIGAGIQVPLEWFDPLRKPGKPDIGAIPFGAEPLKVGLAK